MLYILGYIVLVAAVITLFSAGSKLKNDFKTKEKINKGWGLKSNKKIDIEEIQDISGYFRNIEGSSQGEYIDDITWNDLEMDNIFKDIDTTFSRVGQENLYYMLRNPVYSDKKFQFRNRIIEYFAKNEEHRKSIQYIISKLGMKSGISISNYFYGDDFKEINPVIYRILGLIPLVSIIFIFINIQLFGIVIFTSFVVNLIVHYMAKRKVDYRLRDFSYISQIIKCADDILKTGLDDVVGSYKNKLLDSLKHVKKLKNVFLVSQNNGSDMGFMIEYINILFLFDLVNYSKMSAALKKDVEYFKNIYYIVGLLDSGIAVASYRERTENYCIPNLQESSHKENSKIVIDDMVHPLIEKAVPNSVHIEKDILITGSNASGKSTFLKTMAVNMIFAQTICMCKAKSFNGPYAKIYTSMALRDSISSGESYYIREIKSLKRIIDAINSEIPVICFVDEILRGTNTVERIAASSNILKHVSKMNCICIAATHDVELTHILEKYFKNYHFQERIEEKEVLFDYKIHYGRSVTQNAIKLLELLGYEKNIVKKAQNDAEGFLKTGLWENMQ